MLPLTWPVSQDILYSHQIPLILIFFITTIVTKKSPAKLCFSPSDSLALSINLRSETFLSSSFNLYRLWDFITLCNSPIYLNFLPKNYMWSWPFMWNVGQWPHWVIWPSFTLPLFPLHSYLHILNSFTNAGVPVNFPLHHFRLNHN